MANSYWLLWAMGSAGFAAAAAVTAKVGLRQVDSDQVTLLRTAVMLPLLAVFVWAMNKWPAINTLPRKALLFIALSGAAGAASWLCYFRALHLGAVAKVASVDKLSVMLVAVFAFVFLGERLTISQWLGAGLVTFGAMLMVGR